MAAESLSLASARRIALAAQGFGRPRPNLVTARHLARTIRRLGLVQIDFINVLTPAHYVIPFSRLGAYKRTRFDDVVYRSGEFTEQWAHEASIIPVETWPLLRHRMGARRLRPYGFESFLAQHNQSNYLDVVLQHVRERGRSVAEDLSYPEGAPRRIPGAWHGSVARATLEAHFARGVLAVVNRRADFVRVFDLSERIIPAEHHTRAVPAHDAERELLRIAAAAHGIGTAADFADYFRTPIREVRPRLHELVEAGELVATNVESWREPAYLHRAAELPKRIEASALLSPFDPVVWFRPRVQRLFEFDYRLEVFVPESKRKWGYYVLPFLLRDRLVARVDLKADRAARRLAVLAAYKETHAAGAETASALALELRQMASWLGLDSVSVAKKGNLARELGACLRK